MNLRDNKKRFMGWVGGRKKKGKLMYLYFNFLKRMFLFLNVILYFSEEIY